MAAFSLVFWIESAVKKGLARVLPFMSRSGVSPTWVLVMRAARGAGHEDGRACAQGFGAQGLPRVVRRLRIHCASAGGQRQAPRRAGGSPGRPAHPWPIIRSWENLIAIQGGARSVRL